MKKALLTAAALFAVLNILTACEHSGAEITGEKLLISPEASQGPLFTLAPAKTVSMTEEPKYDTLYSSYAYMRTFDPQTGIAQFDFFELLTGDEAIDYLINCQGYCSAVAETQVSELGEGQFVQNNPSFMLRDIDIKNVPLKLQYYPDGSIAEEQGTDADFEDLKALYASDKSYVLLTHYYYITVDENTKEAVLIEQVYNFVK